MSAQQSIAVSSNMAVDPVESNWQIKRASILDRVAFLWNRELLSDVKFVVPVSNGESETKVIPAHKFVLAISSSVFYAMFYGEMAETTDSIELPDCEYESLLELFRFVYSDDINLTGSNVMHVLYLANKYIVPSLADKCADYLQDNLEASNVFSILPYAQKFEDKDLEDRCWEVIEMHTEEAVTSDEFFTLERSLVEFVVKRECLRVKEVELFKAVDHWAITESERQDTRLIGKEKRRVIGEEIVKAIRFPLMSQKEFISVVPNCNILTEQEIVDMIKHYNNLLTSPLQFSESPRANARVRFGECHRFHSYKRGWGYSHGERERLFVTTNKQIWLHGVQHFGFKACSYKVSLEIHDATNGSCIGNQSGWHNSEGKHYNGYEYFGFDMMFENPVCLKRSMRNCYEIVSLITGNDSWYGDEGKVTVNCRGVQFTFNDAQNISENNGTSVSSGQFPSLLFSLWPKM